MAVEVDLDGVRWRGDGLEYHQPAGAKRAIALDPGRVSAYPARMPRRPPGDVLAVPGASRGVRPYAAPPPSGGL